MSKRFFAACVVCCAGIGNTAAQAQIVGGKFGPLTGIGTGSATVVQLLIEPGYVLDQLSTQPVTAYSVRKMSGGFSSYDIVARRSSDNTQTNVGFFNRKIDPFTLGKFCTGQNCFVVTWKNQGSAGTTGDATQSTASEQPQIVASGAVESQNGVATLNFGNSIVYLQLNLATTYQSLSFMGVAVPSYGGQFLSGSTNGAFAATTLNAGGDIYNLRADVQGVQAVALNTVAMQNQLNVMYGNYSPNNASSYLGVNGTNQTFTSSASFSAPSNIIGAAAGAYNADISEVNFFGSFLGVSDMTILRRNAEEVFKVAGN